MANRGLLLGLLAAGDALNGGVDQYNKTKELRARLANQKSEQDYRTGELKNKQDQIDMMRAYHSDEVSAKQDTLWRQEDKDLQDQDRYDAETAVKNKDELRKTRDDFSKRLATETDPNRAKTIQGNIDAIDSKLMNGVLNYSPVPRSADETPSKPGIIEKARNFFSPPSVEAQPDRSSVPITTPTSSTAPAGDYQRQAADLLKVRKQKKPTQTSSIAPEASPDRSAAASMFEKRYGAHTDFQGTPFNA